MKCSHCNKRAREHYDLCDDCMQKEIDENKSKIEEISLSDKIDGYDPITQIVVRNDIKKFIKKCINDFYGNDKFEDEIRTTIEARDILIKNAGDKLI